jgi:hypothetical protein
MSDYLTESSYNKIIAAIRNEVIQDYESAKARNHRMFLQGNVNATSEYIYSNQKYDAQSVVSMLYQDHRHVVSIRKKTKVGADGFIIELAMLMSTHCDDAFAVDPKNIFIVTGMNNKQWETEMIEKAPQCFKSRIFHHGKLSHVDFKDIKNALIIIDEIDTGNKPDQVLGTLLKTAGILDVKTLKDNNIKIVDISATSLKELYHLYQWGDLHAIYDLTIPDTYIGHTYFRNKDIIREWYPLDTDENAEKWVKEDIIDNYGSDYRVHLVRVNNKTDSKIHNACIRNEIQYIPHTSTTRISEENLNKLFSGPLTQHVVIALRGLLRRSNLIPNSWKLRVGATHELYTKNTDYNVQMQGLPGRMSGYWKPDIENGHKTGPYRTSLDAIDSYDDVYDDPFGRNSYKSAGFNKKEGNVKSLPTMLSASNIDNLSPIDLPDMSVIDITVPYIHVTMLEQYLQEKKKSGTITHYTNTNSTIQYRGITTPLYVYTTHQEFKLKDIKSGVNKVTTCRIMPILYQETLYWIGIYYKTAFEII